MNILIFWISFLIIAGVLLFIKTRRLYLSNNVARKWDKVSGNITHIQSNNNWYALTEKIPQTDTVLIRYNYQHSGSTYVSSSIFLNSENTFISSRNLEGHVFKTNIAAFVKTIKAKPEVWVWVNPEKPEQSILVNNSSRYLTTMMVGLVVVVWAICITLLFTVASRDISKRVTVIETKE